MINSRRRWGLAGLCLGALFLWLALRNVEGAAILRLLATARIEYLALAIAAAAAFALLKTWRWTLVLAPVTRPPFASLHADVYVGTAANLGIAHSGELLRATLVGKRQRVSVSAVLASIGVERIFDLATVALLLGVVMLVEGSVGDSTVAAGAIALALVVAGVAAMVFLLVPSRGRDAAVRLAVRLLPGPVVGYLWDQFSRGLAGLGILARPSSLVAAFALSLLQWASIVVAVWASAAAVGAEIGPSSATVVWILMVVGLTLPSSPVQLGTVQLAFTLGLAAFAVSEDVAFAASVVYTVCVNVYYLVVGVAVWLASTRRSPAFAGHAPS